MIENADGIPVPPNEVKMRLRVSQTYGTTDQTENGGLPKFKFGTQDIYNDINDRKWQSSVRFSYYDAKPILRILWL